MSIFTKLNAVKKVSVTNLQVPMTDEQVASIGQKLKDECRINVYPNRFNMNKPYRVQMRDRATGEYTTFGYFTSVDVAAAVGSIVSLAKFGEKALAGQYDQKAAEKHVEFKSWLADSRNQEVIAKVNAM